MNRFFCLIIVSLWFMSDHCKCQNIMNNPNDRQPAVAGQFYSEDSVKLKKELAELFLQAIPKKTSDVLAIIVPHAGYVFSGGVAASAFSQIDADKAYKTVFLIGSSHKFYFNGAAVYADGNFITPLGTVEVDTALGKKLISENKYFLNDKEAHKTEHCLEVQLPFLQYILKKSFRIVPIVIGTDDAAVCKKIAEGLAPYFTKDNLFVISTDFSHYPNYKDAVKIDKLTANAIETNSAKNLLHVLKSNEELHLPKVLTSLCGWTSVLSLLYITEKMPEVQFTSIQYKNSGDSPLYGDTSRVVGYNAIAISIKKTTDNEFTLSDVEKEKLLQIARNTMESYISNRFIPQIDSSALSEKLKANCGAFVSLHKKGALRGCIGQFTAKKPLYQIVQDMVIAASTQDSRFSRVISSEFPGIDIEISVLSPLRKIESIDEITLGKHGIYIIKGNSSGTFLPQVATETGWTKEEFLGHCAKDKAGIGWSGWKDAEIYIYTAVVFGEKDANPPQK